MHKGAVRTMTEGAGGRTLPVPGGMACGGVVMAPAGKTLKTKGRLSERVSSGHGPSGQGPSRRKTEGRQGNFD